MKKILQQLIFLIVVIFIGSCGGSSSRVPIVDLIPVKTGKDYQYINCDGKIIINPQFSAATVFRDGLALVKTNGDEPMWGYIDKDGKYAIAPNYKQATVFSDNLAWVVTENGAPTAINNRGEIKITLQNAESVKLFHEGLAAFSVIDSAGTSWGFVDATGKVVINPQFSSTGNFSNGKCAVENAEGQWGYIDNTGRIIINYQFDKTKEFRNGKAVVYSGDKAGVIDEAGKYIINPQFDEMLPDGNNFVIEQGKNFGWCDSDGKIIINPQFAQAFPFNGNDLAAVLSGSNWGFIDKEGKFVINPQFTWAFPFNGPVALVMSGLELGFIDRQGKYVINPQYDGVSADFISHVINARAEYESVKTDFFNLASIVNRINLNNPEGISIGSPLSDVLTRLRIDEDKFSKYSSEHTLVSNQKINNDASVSFEVRARAYTEIPDGWYSKKVFNPNAVIEGFSYTIRLSGKGYGKDEEVVSAIEGALAGYTRIGDLEDENDRTYANNKQEVRIVNYRSQISIVVKSIEDESVQIESYAN